VGPAPASPPPPRSLTIDAGPRVQRKAEFGAADGPLEREADEVADEVMRMPNDGDTARHKDAAGHTRLPIQPKGTGPSSVASVAPAGPYVVPGRGRPMPEPWRTNFEARFGYDFSHVRVHTDAKSSESAAALNALAYTIGNNVVFGSGKFAPHTAAGRRLLAHELTHIVQQSKTARSAPYVQRKPDPQSSPGVAFSFPIKISKVLNSDELLLEFIKQYRRVNTNADAAKLRDDEKWHWEKQAPTVTQTDVTKGYILIPVTDIAITPATEAETQQRGEFFKNLSPEEQATINAEADREFSEKTHYKVGKKLGTSADDKKMAEYWKLLRDELIRKRRAIEALPADVQKFLLDENATTTLASKDFDTFLRIASKVAALTPAELAEYKSRVTATTTDWRTYEDSVDRFLAEHKEREATAKERGNIETQLLGLDDLYQRYTNYMGWSLHPTSDRKSHEEQGARLDADLKTAGFPGGITDFTKLIHDYEKAFERETLAIARVMLDRYEHVLIEEDKKYQNPAASASLYQSVGQTQARRHFHEVMEGPPWVTENPALPLSPIEARKQAETEVLGATGGHPLVQNVDFDREQLAKAADSTQVKSIMLGYIAARRKDIGDTRKTLIEKPKMIYGKGFDVLREASFKAQKIKSGTIQKKIIDKYVDDEQWKEDIPRSVLTVIAVAAGLLTSGGGTVAVLAAGATVGIGAYQAIEEFRRYAIDSGAFHAKLADDPTMAWVIVAVIGVGIDAAVFIKALPQLLPALRAFNAGAEAGDVAKLTEKLKDVEERLRNSIIRAAEAEAQARTAWKAIFRPSAGLPMVIAPDAEEFTRFVYAVYLSAKRGIRGLDVFLKTNEAIELIGDITKLSAEELAALKAGYLEALKEIDAIAAQGQALGMTDGEIRAFMNLRSNTKGMTAAQVAEEMKAWKTANPGLTVDVTQKQWRRLQRVSEALNDESKWVNVTAKDRWRIGRVYDSLLEKLVSAGVQRTGQKVIHYADLTPELIAKLRGAGERVLVTEGRLSSQGLRVDMLEIDFAKGRAELVDLAATSSPAHLAKTRNYKNALEKALGMPVEAKELYYVGSNGELLEDLVEVLVK
jgi:hypothetical protein